ncbi:MAG TPA: glycoside hydrolase family 2 protein, partial [Bacteroidota bacterium]|nr:glycoside hydrolase family 2 protein [Bacteroidota bacterium]
QENDVQWVDGLAWEYRKEFTVPADFLSAGAIDLVAAGLDTYALVTCNGRQVGSSSNMFVGHRFPIKRFLRKGRNVLSILFDSPVERSKRLEKEHGRLRVALEPHRVYVRKAQYSFSWDWGPKLTTSGIWRGIALEAFSAGRLADPSAKVASLTRGKAVLKFSSGVIRRGSRPLTLRLFLGGPDRAAEYTHSVNGNDVHFTVVVPDPHIWWPNGHGEQPLYTALFTLLDGEEVLDEKQVRFGIRTVRLLQTKDAQGKSFIVEVNGRKIFCKGADWIPADSFIPRISPSTYDRLLRMAKDAHMNMIRVWGGGFYEEDLFYDLCDRLGIMVWQDFMFACGEYPEAHWFTSGVREEAAKAVARLRNHPSIVLWCGNNECEWLFCTENPGKSPDAMKGAKIFRDLLPSVVRSLDGTRPYWRSSPFGDGFPNDESNGNHHQWRVWSDWKDYPEYEKDNARFVTEFGFQGPANLATFRDVTLPPDRHPQSEVMEHHNKQVEGTERLIRFIAAHHRLPADLEEYVAKGQSVQAEALKCAAEHWRRRKYGTAGVLFWQLNDCWPVTSWSVIDSAIRPKAAYYYAKRFYAPLLVSFRKAAAGVEVWVTSDIPLPVRASLDVALLSFDGKAVMTKKSIVRLKSDSSVRIWTIAWEELRRHGLGAHYLRARCSAEGTPPGENRIYFAEPKHMDLPDPRLSWKVKRRGGTSFEIEVRAKGLARGVRLEIEGTDVLFDDNVFDMDGGTARTVRCTAEISPRRFRRNLTVRPIG